MVPELPKTGKNKNITDGWAGPLRSASDRRDSVNSETDA
jgi:hypothetical protein